MGGDEQGRPLAETDLVDLVTFMDRDVCSCFLGSMNAAVFKYLVLLKYYQMFIQLSENHIFCQFSNRQLKKYFWR